MDLFIASAYAQSTAAPQADLFGSFAPIILMIVAFYFIMIRPQTKRMKLHQQMISSLTKGDKVVTAGGIIGTVQKVNEDNDTFSIQIAKNVEIEIRRGTINEKILPPQKETKKKKK